MKQTLPFDFDDNYNYIKNKFAKAGFDTEEGSTTMQLATAMSYAVSMLNANTAVNINETILTLSTKRDIALYNARTLGYEVEHIRSFRYNVLLELDNTTESDKVFNIPQFTEFSAGDKTYYYINDDINETVPAMESKQITIEIKEGTMYNYSDYPALNVVITATVSETGEMLVKNYIDVPFTDIEEDGIYLFMTYYDTAGAYHQDEEWTKSDTFLIDADTVLNKQYVRLDNIEYSTPRLHFKIGDVGTGLTTGTLIKMNVLQSSGADGAIIGGLNIGPAPKSAGTVSFESSTPTTQAPVSNLTGVSVLDYSLLMTGTSEEELTSIKTNAPLFHNTANRVITKPDYIAFCTRNAFVKYSSVWDGNDEYPHQKGHIWFSFIPSIVKRVITPNDTSNKIYTMNDLRNFDNWYLDKDGDTSIQEIYDYLDYYKIPTLVFHHRNPIFLDFNFNIEVVRYNTSRTRAETHAQIFEVINKYFLDNVEFYESEFLMSNLQKRIDEELTDGTGFNMSLTTQILLTKVNVINDNTLEVDQNGDIRFHLSTPFETMFEDKYIITEKMPKLDTFNFIGTSSIYVDARFSTVDDFGRTGYYIRLGDGSSESPLDDDEIIGTYFVNKKVKADIEVVLRLSEYLVNDSDALTLNVVYPSANMSCIRNTIPRLRSVKFTEIN